MELEDGGGVATEPDRGNAFSSDMGWLLATIGAAFVGTSAGVALLICCTYQGNTSCRCQEFPWVVAVELGLFVAVGFALWAFLALRFCCCCWRSGYLDERPGGVMDAI